MKIFIFSLTFSVCSLCIAQNSTEIIESFESFDGTKISYTDSGKGEAVLLLHGFISNGSSWDQTVLKRKLLEKGYRLIIPDLRGNGNSDHPQDPEYYKNNSEIKDLILLADHLGLKSYIAIGYSRGSIILAKLLTQEPRISKAVMGGMGFDFTDPNWDRRIAFADAFNGRSALNEMTQGAVNYAKSINADLQILGWLQDYQPVTSAEELNKIEVRTLIICGDEDKDNGDPRLLQSHLPNSQLSIIEGNHNNTYKQENFAIEVMDFISEK